MMFTLRGALGEDRIMGAEFPQDEGLKRFLEKHEDETDSEYDARMYVREQRVDLGREEEDRRLIREMNPNGFWECRYSVQVVDWHLGIEEECLPDKVCKIVSQGLARTDPQFVDKVIFMARSPRQVAKSQENLRHMPVGTIQEQRDMKIHTPLMFCNVTAAVAMWLKAYPDVPVHMVVFDDFIERPDEVLEGVREFLGEGDFSGHPVNPKLRRSYPEDIEHYLWPYADHMYELLLRKDWAAIVEYFQENARDIHKKETSVYCARRATPAPYGECVLCRGDKLTRDNFRRQAESSGIDWRTEPCMFECLSPSCEGHVSMAESVERNFWVEEVPARAEGDKALLV